jgi:hypothetical protein
MAVLGEAVEPIDVAEQPAFDKGKVIVIFVLGGPGAGELVFATPLRALHSDCLVIRERDTVRKTR